METHLAQAWRDHEYSIKLVLVESFRLHELLHQRRLPRARFPTDHHTKVWLDSFLLFICQFQARNGINNVLLGLQNRQLMRVCASCVSIYARSWVESGYRRLLKMGAHHCELQLNYSVGRMFGGGINMMQQQPYQDVGTLMHERMDNGVVITLRSTDSKTQFSIPQLQKQFASAGVGDEVQFIVKSFSFHTEFINLKQGDGFNFVLEYFDVQRQNSLSEDRAYLGFSRIYEPFAVPLIIDTDLTEIHVTTDEFITILNRSKLHALRAFAHTHTLGTTIAPDPAEEYGHSMAFNILANSEFIYDYTVGKVGLHVDFQGRHQMHYHQHTSGSDTYVNFKLVMQPFSDLQPLEQYRLAQLMGFGTNEDTTINSKMTAIYEHTYTSPLMETYLFRPSGVNVTYYPPDQRQEMTLYSPYVSDNLPNKFVIIKSSARSNVVSGMGKREGILLSIAITQTSTELYQTYQEERLEFASKDTLQGLKSMSIEFVDEFGRFLYFRSPYELKLGVYFK